MFTAKAQDETVSLTKREAAILAKFLHNHVDMPTRPHLAGMIQKLMPGITGQDWIGVATADAMLRDLQGVTDKIELGTKVRIKPQAPGEVGDANRQWHYRSPGPHSVGVVSSMDLRLPGNNCRLSVQVTDSGGDEDFNTLTIPDGVTDLSEWLEVVKD